MAQRHCGHTAGQKYQALGAHMSRGATKPVAEPIPYHRPAPHPAPTASFPLLSAFLPKAAGSSWAWAGDGQPTVCTSWFGLSITKCSGIFLELGVGKNLLLSGPKAWLVFRGKQETRP